MCPLLLNISLLVHQPSKITSFCVYLYCSVHIVFVVFGLFSVFVCALNFISESVDLFKEMTITFKKKYSTISPDFTRCANILYRVAVMLRRISFTLKPVLKALN